MLYIFNILVLLIISFSLIVITKRKFEEVMPITVFSVVIFLYFFALFGAVKLGAIFFLILVLLLLCYTLIKIIKNKTLKKNLKKFITPGFLFFIILCILTAYISNGRLLAKWDEFISWGLQLKNMYIFHGLANIKGVTTLGTGYPPATTLFEYFFCFLRNNLIEGDMFRAMGIFTFSIILPVFKKVSWKNVTKIILIFLIVFLLPSIFTKDMHYLNTLYVDAILGLIMAYVLYTYFTERFSKYLFLSVGIGCFVLSIVKSTGFPLMLVICGMIFVDIVFFRRIEFKKFITTKINLITIILSVFIGFFGKITWQIFVKIASLNEIWSYVNVDSSKNQKLIIDNFISSFFSGNAGSVYGISFFLWIPISLIFMSLIMLILKNKKQNIRLFICFIIMILGYLSYSISLLGMYLFLFIEYEGINLASMGRYMDTYILAMMMFIIMLFINKIERLKISRQYVVLICILGMIFFSNTF